MDTLMTDTLQITIYYSTPQILFESTFINEKNICFLCCLQNFPNILSSDFLIRL